MLNDSKLHKLKSMDTPYKVNHLDGLSVSVTSAASLSSRYNYAINCRHPFGRCGAGCITLSQAREQLGQANMLFEIDFLRQTGMLCTSLNWGRCHEFETV